MASSGNDKRDSAEFTPEFIDEVSNVLGKLKQKLEKSKKSAADGSDRTQILEPSEDARIVGLIDTLQNTLDTVLKDEKSSSESGAVLNSCSPTEDESESEEEETDDFRGESDDNADDEYETETIETVETAIQLKPNREQASPISPDLPEQSSSKLSNSGSCSSVYSVQRRSSRDEARTCLSSAIGQCKSRESVIKSQTDDAASESTDRSVIMSPDITQVEPCLDGSIKPKNTSKLPWKVRVAKKRLEKSSSPQSPQSQTSLPTNIYYPSPKPYQSPNPLQSKSTGDVMSLISKENSFFPSRMDSNSSGNIPHMTKCLNTSRSTSSLHLRNRRNSKPASDYSDNDEDGEIFSCDLKNKAASICEMSSKLADTPAKIAPKRAFKVDNGDVMKKSGMFEKQPTDPKEHIRPAPRRKIQPPVEFQQPIEVAPKSGTTINGSADKSPKRPNNKCLSMNKEQTSALGSVQGTVNAIPLSKSGMDSTKAVEKTILLNATSVLSSSHPTDSAKVTSVKCSNDSQPSIERLTDIPEQDVSAASNLKPCFISKVGELKTNKVSSIQSKFEVPTKVKADTDEKIVEKTPTKSNDCNTLLNLTSDPKEFLFTKQQLVQIAIHKAAINKQLSVGEEKRRGEMERTMSLSEPKSETPIIRRGQSVQENSTHSIVKVVEDPAKAAEKQKLIDDAKALECKWQKQLKTQRLNHNKNKERLLRQQSVDQQDLESPTAINVTDVWSPVAAPSPVKQPVSPDALQKENISCSLATPDIMEPNTDIISSETTINTGNQSNMISSQDSTSNSNNNCIEDKSVITTKKETAVNSTLIHQQKIRQESSDEEVSNAKFGRTSRSLVRRNEKKESSGRTSNIPEKNDSTLKRRSLSASSYTKYNADFETVLANKTEQQSSTNHTQDSTENEKFPWVKNIGQMKPDLPEFEAAQNGEPPPAKVDQSAIKTPSTSSGSNSQNTGNQSSFSQIYCTETKSEKPSTRSVPSRTFSLPGTDPIETHKIGFQHMNHPDHALSQANSVFQKWKCLDKDASEPNPVPVSSSGKTTSSFAKNKTQQAPPSPDSNLAFSIPKVQRKTSAPDVRNKPKYTDFVVPPLPTSAHKILAFERENSTGPSTPPYSPQPGVRKSGGTTSHVTKTFSSGQSGQSALNKFKQLDSQQPGAKSPRKVCGPLFTLSSSLNRSATSIKDMILNWCQCRTRGYQGVKIENFSTSWNDGMAFCALIHHFFPDAFDFNSLNPKNRRYNFTLAFRVADETAGVFPLLDVEDMVMMQKPDWKCVFTYVQTLYKRLKDE